MFFFLIFLIQSKTHVHVTNILLGNWIVEHNFIGSNENDSYSNFFNITFTKIDDNTLITQSTRDSDSVYKLTFHEGGLFDLINDSTSDEIAEFEFFHPLFPHASSNGSWKKDSIFIAELISDTSIQFGEL